MRRSRILCDFRAYHSEPKPFGFGRATLTIKLALIAALLPT